MSVATSSRGKYEPLNVEASQADSVAVTPEVVAVEVIESTVTPPMYSKSAAVEPVASPMMLEVVAPASLWEGYELEVNVGGETLTVIVPPGGVEQGQKFMASVAPSSMKSNRQSAPVGAWKDGLCDCCTYGCCHPLVWTAFCCLPVVLAQVLYRMKLDWCGFPTSREKATESFYVVVGIFAGYIVLRYFIIPLLNNGTLEGKSAVASFQAFADLAFLVYFVVIMSRARRFVRNKYAIPATDCGESCEDCCCSCWCKCCALTQMARHTADYDTYAAQCCSMSGLPPHVPEIV